MAEGLLLLGFEIWLWAAGSGVAGLRASGPKCELNLALGGIVLHFSQEGNLNLGSFPLTVTVLKF